MISARQDTRAVYSNPFRLIAILAMMAWAALAFAQVGKGNDVEALLVSPLVVSIAPGSIVSVSVRVTNPGDEELRLKEMLTLPDNWQAVIPPSTFTLAPRRSTVRLLAVQIPGATSAGPYSLRYTVRGVNEPSISDEESFTVNVLPNNRLSLLVEDKPEYAIAGQPYRLRVRVMNNGNSPVEVELSARGVQRQWPITIEPTRLALAPRASGIAVITVRTAPSERVAFTNTIAVRGTAGKAEAQAQISVRVLPHSTGKIDLTHTIPVEMGMSVLGSERSSGMQYSLQGQGFVDAGNTAWIDFLLNGPDLRRHSLYALNNESRANYRSDRLDLRLGDQSYGLSPLTEPARYGSGVALAFRSPDAVDDLGAFLVANDGDIARKTRGFFVRHRIGDASIKANLLSRSTDLPDSEQTVRDHILSLETALHPTKNLGVELELAGSSTNRDGEGHDDAYRVNVSGRLPGNGYMTLNHVTAGPDFHGYYHDTRLTSATISQPVSSRLTLTPSYSLWRRNLTLDPLRDSAPDEQLAQLGVCYAFASDWSMNLLLADDRYRDLLTPADGDSRERVVRLGVGHDAGQWRWRADLERSVEDNQREGNSEEATGVRVFTSYRPNSTQYFTFFGGYSGSDRESGLLGNSRYLGASTIWTPSAQWDITGNVTINGQRENLVDYGNAELAVRRNFTDGQSLLLQAHQTTGDEAQTDYALSYHFPLHLPVSRRHDIGAVSGRIFESRLPGKPGIGNVVLMLNGAGVVTDADGRFGFPAVKPGTYTLTIDLLSLGQQRITDRPLPITVVVKGGEISTVDIPVQDGVSLRGTVLKMPPAPEDGMSPPATDAVGLPNIFVEVSNGQETYRRVTEKDGSFVFERLRPGAWHVKVYNDNLPERHYLESATADVTLQPGQQSPALTFRALPRARRIKMLPDPLEGKSQPSPVATSRVR